MKKALIILVHAFIGWAFCAAIMAIGPLLTTMNNTLIVHLTLGPIGFGILSAIYHRKFEYTRPIVTAMIFLLFIAVMDFFLVGMIILKSTEMFKSIIGIWLPFALIFLFTWGIGRFVQRNKKSIVR